MRCIKNNCPYTHILVQSSPFIKKTSFCERWRLLQKITANQIAKLWSVALINIYNAIVELSLRYHWGRRRTIKARTQGVCWETVCPHNVTSYILQASWADLPKHELNSNERTGHVTVDVDGQSSKGSAFSLELQPMKECWNWVKWDFLLESTAIGV